MNKEVWSSQVSAWFCYLCCWLIDAYVLWAQAFKSIISQQTNSSMNSVQSCPFWLLLYCIRTYIYICTYVSISSTDQVEWLRKRCVRHFILKINTWLVLQTHPLHAVLSLGQTMSKAAASNIKKTVLCQKRKESAKPKDEQDNHAA